jgi:hypothetical protein
MEALVFVATAVSYSAHLHTFFNNCDNLNLNPCAEVPMSRALAVRAGGLIAGPILNAVMALIGRVFSRLIPI